MSPESVAEYTTVTVKSKLRDRGTNERTVYGRRQNAKHEERMKNCEKKILQQETPCES